MCYDEADQLFELGFAPQLNEICKELPSNRQSMLISATLPSMLLEFSSTVVALILAGKVGSNIASEIGTMRITEQIDALEILSLIHI